MNIECSGNQQTMMMIKLNYYTDDILTDNKMTIKEQKLLLMS